MSVTITDIVATNLQNIAATSTDLVSQINPENPELALHFLESLYGLCKSAKDKNSYAIVNKITSSKNLTDKIEHNLRILRALYGAQANYADS